MNLFNLFKKEEIYAQDLTGSNISVWNLNAALRLSHETEVKDTKRIFLEDTLSFLELDTEKRFIQLGNLIDLTDIKNRNDEAIVRFCNCVNSSYVLVKLTYEKEADCIYCCYDYPYSNRIHIPHLNLVIRYYGDIIREVYSKFTEEFPEEQKPEEQTKEKDSIPQ